MGDFLLDLRPAGERSLGPAAEFLKFYPDMTVERFDFPEFSLLVSSSDATPLWQPFTAPDGSLFVAVCGRIALESKQWDEAEKESGPGGLAGKFIAHAYARQGLAAVENLSGNFVILLFDRRQRKLFLVTDRWGLVPAFRFQAGDGSLGYASHPDALADAVGESRNWDLTSFAEFILTGKISSPFTYYSRIKGLPAASATELSFRENERPAEKNRVYFSFDHRPQPEQRFEELAEEFAAAFRNAVSKRSLPRLGRSAVALSGGLDSRTILASVPDRKNLLTFSCYDQENREFRIAQAIAKAAGAEFVPLKRPFDYYGDHAAMGVRISAGMGCIASNHFLGFRNNLKELGVDNLLTGCYCDYLFKGLALNKRTNPWTTTEHLNPFGFSYYFGHFAADTPLGLGVRRRLEEIFPADLRRYNNEAAVWGVEQRRIFPLSYEEDNAERTIPQRVMGWYVPIADNALMEVMLKMSAPLKLNRRLFARMVEKVCGPEICGIPDANTGVPVNASIFREALQANLHRAERLYRKIKPSNATSGSWLNWGYYARNSKTVQSLWASPNAEAREIFDQILGPNGFKPDIAAYEGKQIYLFLQLFTLKLWFDQRSK